MNEETTDPTEFRNNLEIELFRDDEIIYWLDEFDPRKVWYETGWIFSSEPSRTPSETEQQRGAEFLAK